MDAHQRRMQVANHEAAHAVAMWMFGRRIREIDVDRPDGWLDGWVVPESPEPIPMPPVGVDVLGWVDAHLERSRRETAVIASIGALAAGDDWLSPRCERDRAIVLAACTSWLTPDKWETWVLWLAEELIADPRFKPAHRALSRALLDRRYEAMPGDRAVQVIEAALWSSFGVNEDHDLRVVGEAT